MKNGLFKKWLAAALCVLALGSTAALAEPDSFGLGTGRNGALSVTTAGTVINSYAQVTGPLAPGDTTVPVGTCLGAPSCFAAGDLVMVLQTTGLVPVPPSGGTGAIDISNDPVGRWEFARLTSVTGSTLTLTAPLIHSYAANVTQVIRVPEYTTVNLTTTGRLIASPWNGSAGGIIAFLATGAVSNAGQINANSAGFRGGMYVDDDSSTTACSGLDEDAPKGAQKGEGIADVRYGPAHTGRGNVANGAGGGICYKSGGGGGGNYGAGGVGGRSEGSFDGARLVGGLGGTALVYSMLNHLTPGGGGGAGHGADGSGAPGGRGGGIIFIRANQLTGTGTIQASGGSGGSSAEDGGSGGGAGGSIYLRFAGTAACGSVSANGGVGGTVNTGRVGPGGGGGGGRVLFQAALGGTCNLILVGAAPGNQQDPTAPDGTTYGATVGANGNSVTLTGGFVVPSVPSVTTPADGLITSNRQPDIRGKAQPNTTVVIYIDGVEVGRTMSNASGDYIFGLPFALSEGNHTVQAATELNEVQSPRSAANTFTVDVTAPAAPVVSAPADGALLNTSKPAITGTAEPHSTVTVIIDGVAVGTVKADAAGNWSYTPTTALTEGPHTVKATAKDAAGNISPESAQNSFRVDTAAPAAPTVTTPSEGEYLKTPTPAITGKAEPDSTVTVIIDGVAVGTVKADAAGNWSYTPTTPLGEGPHTVKATATDAAGNTSPESSVRNFFVDTVVPVAPVVVSPGSGSVVNDSTPTITGTAEANSTVTVIIDGVPVAVVPVDASGAWTYTPTTPLLDGSHEVKATATDAAGNTSPESAQNSFIVDTAVPAVPAVTAPSEGAHVKTPTPVITGTAEPGSTVTVIIDGVAAGTVTADAAGNWSYTPTTDLTEGPHTVTATAKDAAGNTSPESPVRNFTVDTVIPAAPAVTAPGEGAHVKTPTPVITGTAEPHSTVTVIIDGTVVGTVTADGSGNWSYTPTTSLDDGPHTVKATATDAAGNTSPESSVRNFFVDTAVPAAPTVSTPANGTVVGTKTPAMTGTAEPHSTVTVIIDGVAVGTVKADAAGNWSYTPTTDLSEGPHTVKATATDAAGNISPESAQNSFTVDTGSPLAPSVTAPGEGAHVKTPTPVITGTAEPGSTVTVIIDDVAVGTVTADAAGNWSYTPATDLSDGPHSVKATAKDAAGNISPESNVRHFIVDTVVPAVPAVTAPSEGAHVTTPAPVISGTAEPGSTVTVIIDGVEVGTAQTDASGNWSYTPATPLTEGPHTVTVRATDAAGNTSEGSAGHSFTIVQDSAAPDTTITSGPVGTTSENSATFTFDSNEPGVTYECSLDGADFAPCLSPVTFTGLSEGEHTVRVRARDAAGNVDATPATRTWTVSADSGNTGGDIAFLGDGVGCSATGGDASLVLVGLGTFLTLARRRRRQ
ncbi:adventurous gliding motility protein AgmC [Archangium minus]